MIFFDIPSIHLHLYCVYFYVTVLYIYETRMYSVQAFLPTYQHVSAVLPIPSTPRRSLALVVGGGDAFGCGQFSAAVWRDIHLRDSLMLKTYHSSLLPAASSAADSRC